MSNSERAKSSTRILRERPRTFHLPSAIHHFNTTKHSLPLPTKHPDPISNHASSTWRSRARPPQAYRPRRKARDHRPSTRPPALDCRGTLARRPSCTPRGRHSPGPRPVRPDGLDRCVRPPLPMRSRRTKEHPLTALPAVSQSAHPSATQSAAGSAAAAARPQRRTPPAPSSRRSTRSTRRRRRRPGRAQRTSPVSATAWMRTRAV